MSLKIAYITDERYPSIHTDTQQVIKTADALGEKGCTVHLVQPRMASHLLLSRKERKRAICDYFNVEGRFEIRDVLSWPASDLRIEKLTHGVLGPLRALLAEYDVIYTRNMLPLALSSALRQNVLFETYRALPKTDPWTWRAVQLSARGKRFLGISTHSEYARQTMIETGADPSTIAAIPNGFDPADFAAGPDRAAARAALKMDSARKVAVYTGQIRPDKGIGALIDLAEDVPETTFLIVGGTPKDVADVQLEISHRSLKNVVLTGQVPLTEVPLYLAVADTLVLPTTALPLEQAGRTVLPIKTFTYLAAGRPILAPALPDTAGVLVGGENALLVKADDRRDAAAGLRLLNEDESLAKRLAERAAQDAQKFTWSARAERLIAFMKERLSSRT